MRNLTLGVLLALSISLMPAAYADNTKPAWVKQCEYNGFSQVSIVNAVKTLQDSFKNHNFEKLADLFTYPFNVNLQNSGFRTIQSKKDFLKNIHKIFTPGDIDYFANKIKPSDAFCRYDGVALGNLWLKNHGRDDQLYAYVINASKGARLKPGSINGQTIVKPIKDPKVLKTFIDAYNKIPFKKDALHYRYQPPADGQAAYIDGCYDKCGIASNVMVSLYHVDINNDGVKEWVTTETSGDMSLSSIGHVYVMHDGQLNEIKNPLSVLVNPEDGPYMSLANYAPFGIKKGLVYVNFNQQPPYSTELWKDGKLQ